MHVPIAYIRQGLSSFDSNPGRLNLLDLGDIRVCVDYGHNPAGYQALIGTVRRLGAKRLVGVIAAPGDRRDDVIVNIGRIAGRGFDYIYIKEDRDRRGRQSGATAALLRQGVLENLPADRVEVILDEAEAMMQAIQKAQAGDLIVVFYEEYAAIMATIEQIGRNREVGANNEPEVADDDQLIVAGVKTV
jgi:cyanophycin synthetase